jgi:hypothetical protein
VGLDDQGARRCRAKGFSRKILLDLPSFHLLFFRPERLVVGAAR